MRWLPPVFLSLFLLGGCVSRRQIEKARTDISNLEQARHERDIRERCLESGAIPGTAAYLDCEMKLRKPPTKQAPC